MAKKKPNVLLIAIDSLLSTHMSCYGYERQTTPHIDRFAEGATLFENTISPHIPTTSAYASMLTGMDCFTNQVVALRHRGPMRKQVKSAAEIFRKNNYNTSCIGFPNNPAGRGFANYVNYESWSPGEDGKCHKAEDLNTVFFPELDRLNKSKKPFFAMLRHMDPHSPYLPPEPYDRLFYQGNEFDKKNKSMDPVFTDPVFGDYLKSWMPQGLTDSDYEVAQYDGAIAYMDTCIQQIFLKLETMGIMDDTIVILNGDHGETLYDHDCWFDHHGLYDVTLKVPLMIRYPEKLPAGKRISGYNTHKDLLPTILELAGLKTDIKFDGESLMKLVTGKKESFESSIYITECTWMRKHGLRTPQWKLIVALEPDFHGKPEVELYNLIEDPDENKNVAKKFPEVVACLRAEMEKHIAKREKETGLANPMHNQPHWHGNQDIDYFESSSQAADVLYIGSVAGANKLQNKKAK